MIAEWAGKAVVRAYTYDHEHSTEQLAVASAYFTPDGWRDFRSVLDASGNVTQVRRLRLIAVAELRGVPDLMAERQIGDTRVFDVMVPMTVTFMPPVGKSSAQWLDSRVVVMSRGDAAGGAASLFILSVNTTVHELSR